MAIENRTTTITGVFAEDAATTIPTTPISGESYRNTALTEADANDGWKYKNIVDSANFNQVLYEATKIAKLLETCGILPWSSLTDYESGAYCLGTDGKIYKAKQATGPSTTAMNPLSDTTAVYWDNYFDNNFVTIATTQSIESQKIFKVDMNGVVDVVNGTTPATQKKFHYGILDKNGAWLGGWEHYYNTDGTTGKQLAVRKQDGSDNYAILSIGYDPQGAEFFRATQGVLSSMVYYGTPNYGAATQIASGYQATANGLLKVRHLEWKNAQVYINNGLVYNHTWAGGDYGSQYQETFMPVTKSSTVTFANVEAVFFIPYFGG